MAGLESPGPGSGDAPRAGEAPGEPEFIDEGPGSYLAEWGTGRGSIVWGLVSLLATLGLGLALQLRPLDEQSEWLALVSLVKALLPVSLVVLLVLTLWRLGTAYTPKSPRRMLWAMGLAVGALAAWGVCEWGLGVLGGAEA
jgi:hypothetical protein